MATREYINPIYSCYLNILYYIIYEEHEGIKISNEYRIFIYNKIAQKYT